MTIFVDASVLVAIIAGESDADVLADRLDADHHRLCSALSVWETVAGLCRSHGLSVLEGRARARLFLEAGAFTFVPIGETEYALAAEAYGTFGKGRHRAALNTGDCFAYVCAKANKAKLFYKGDDFSHTDLA